MRTLVIGGLAAAFLLAGCGGSGEGDSGGEEADRAFEGAPAFVCADEAKAKPVPAAFPADFPLPDGSVVIGSEARSEGRIIVYAVSPADVKATLHALQQGLPAAGFQLTEGEVEEHDAESSWTGNGYRGRWAIRTIPDCEGDTSVTVLAQRT